jgi:hypothetical protein
MRPSPSSVPVKPVYHVMMARSSVSVTSSRFTGVMSSRCFGVSATPLSIALLANSGDAAATPDQRRKSRRVKSQLGTARH